MSRQCVVFSTPGLIPIESFTTFGVNAKPASTNPFGYFGTGLKYAVAVLLRSGCEVVLWRGKDKYTFYVKDEDFRGKEFGFVRMKLEKWSIRGFLGAPKYQALPFTTELGKNWELWQAFRELETNTRDEAGSTYLDTDDLIIAEDWTRILVYGSRFVDEFHDRDRNFLPEGKVVREDEAVQVIDRKSKHIYYRSVRIMDLKEESRFTYNFLKHVELTEDRTAKFPYQLEQELVQLISQSEDKGFIGRAIGSGGYESRMNYGYGYSAPSKSFISVVKSSPRPPAGARELVDKYAPQMPSTTTISIIVPKSSVSDKEMGDLRIAVEAIFGRGSKLRNMAVGDGELLF